MQYAPRNLVRCPEPEADLGASWPQYFSTGIAEGRRSGVIERSNFASVLRALGGETETVKVVGSEGLGGRFEWIAIHESDAKALQIADKIKEDLADFSIVDLDHFYEVEREEAHLTWKNCFGPMERIAYIRELRVSFKFHDLADLIGCVRGKTFSGDASELLEQLS